MPAAISVQKASGSAIDLAWTASYSVFSVLGTAAPFLLRISRRPGPSPTGLGCSLPPAGRPAVTPAGSAARPRRPPTRSRPRRSDPIACISRKFPGSSSWPTRWTTRADIGTADTPAAPIIGFTASLLSRFISLPKSTPVAVATAKAAIPSAKM